MQTWGKKRALCSSVAPPVSSSKSALMSCFGWHPGNNSLLSPSLSSCFGCKSCSDIDHEHQLAVLYFLHYTQNLFDKIFPAKKFWFVSLNPLNVHIHRSMRQQLNDRKTKSVTELLCHFAQSIFLEEKSELFIKCWRIKTWLIDCRKNCHLALWKLGFTFYRDLLSWSWLHADTYVAMTWWNGHRKSQSQGLWFA